MGVDASSVEDNSLKLVIKLLEVAVLVAVSVTPENGSLEAEYGLAKLNESDRSVKLCALDASGVIDGTAWLKTL